MTTVMIDVGTILDTVYNVKSVRRVSQSADGYTRVVLQGFSEWNVPPERLDAGQFPQLLQQPHHRPGISLAVVQQVLAHPVVLVARDPAGHEEQSRDLHARHAAVHDHEVVVGESGNERGEDRLETEAPPEGGVIHAITDNGIEIEQ